MRFYRLDAQSGEKIRSYPEIKISLEVVVSKDHLAVQKEFLCEIDKLVEKLGLLTTDTVTRVYVPVRETVSWGKRRIQKICRGSQQVSNLKRKSFQAKVSNPE